MSGLEDFNTDVLIRHTEMAPYPDTTTFIQKLEREREARERGEVRDNRGFFAKYVSTKKSECIKLFELYTGAMCLHIHMTNIRQTSFI